MCEIRRARNYIKKTNDKTYDLGDKIIVDDPLIYSSIELLTEVATIIDEQVKEKFFLPT